MKALFGAISVALLLVACGPEGASVESTNAGVLTRMQSEKDTPAAIDIFNRRRAELAKWLGACQNTFLDSERCNRNSQVSDQFTHDGDLILRERALAADESAIAFLWDETLLPGTRASLARLAVKSADLTQNAKILLIAGDAVSEGRVVQRDVALATTYFSRSWGNGGQAAAMRLAALFYRINDYRSAYLWVLRCTDVCQDAGQRELFSAGFFEARLSSEAIRQVQAVAKDLTVIDLPGNE